MDKTDHRFQVPRFIDHEIKFPPISEQIKKICEMGDAVPRASDTMLKEIRLTMIVNYGDNGRTIGGLVKDSQSELQMILSVLMHYHEQFLSGIE